jgi:hypothetical protein
MSHMRRYLRSGAAAFVLLVPALAASGAELPPEIVAKGEPIVLQVHAEGAQIYECKTDSNNHLSWQFREPIATLIAEGKTIGRHYAGPSWEIGGSTVVGKVVGRAPGASGKDIPWLKLNVSEQRGGVPLKDVTTIQRINTKGGNLDGGCDTAGAFQAEPYAADYVFLRKAP